MSNVVNKETNTADDLAAFHKFIGELLTNGSHDLSPEEALDLWRDEHPLPEDFEESVAALREALDDLDAGDTGIPAEQFFREFRERHGLPPQGGRIGSTFCLGHRATPIALLHGCKRDLKSAPQHG